MLEYIFDKTSVYFNKCKNDRRTFSLNNKHRIIYLGRETIYITDILRNEDIKNNFDIFILNVNTIEELYYQTLKDSDIYSKTIFICYKEACNIFNYLIRRNRDIYYKISNIIYVDPIRSIGDEIFPFIYIKNMYIWIDSFYLNEYEAGLDPKIEIFKRDRFYKNIITKQPSDSNLLSSNIMNHILNCFELDKSYSDCEVFENEAEAEDEKSDISLD
jgi:hypothetical protein